MTGLPTKYYDNTNTHEENMEFVNARKLLSQHKDYLQRELYYKITEKHLEAVRFYRNAQVQEVLKNIQDDKDSKKL